VLTERLEFVAERDSETFAAVPASPAVFLLRGVEQRSEPYISKTANLRRRLHRLLGSIEGRTRKLNLRDRIRSVEYTLTGSDFESGFLLYQLLRATFPKTYADRLRFRFAPLVKMHLENEYPRASITTQLGRLNRRSHYYGPFLSRAAAEKFMNDSLDFFKMRRCVDDLDPDPKFPGCIYSEMKMCLAPCFKGCSDEEYKREVGRVEDYFDSGGESLVRELSEQREAASANLEFENAAALHARIEKLKSVLGQQPEIVHRLDQMHAIMVQPWTAAESVVFYRVEAGCISGPIAFPILSTAHAKSQSMELRVQKALDSFPPARAKSVLETMEHLALFKRWYYRSRRVGEVFFADDRGVLPLRRVVRGISRVYRGEHPETAAIAPSFPQGQQVKNEQRQENNQDER
jgi:excinuclease ABC subunit C